MIAHQRGELAARNHFNFSFTNPIQRANDDPGRPDEIEYITWAEGMKGGYSYFGKPGKQRSGAWTRRAPVKEGEEDDDSDVPSPKLWDQAMTARAQVIAGYRQEMMELVRDVPESAYELSLKDIVELPRRERPVQEAPPPVKGKEQKAVKKVLTRKISRSDSMDSGVFLLRMFFPFSFGGWKRSRSSGSSRGARSKVSPKPSELQKTSDGEWWDKNEYGDMSSSNGSSNSSSSIISCRSRKLSSCYSFFLNGRSKARVI